MMREEPDDQWNRARRDQVHPMDWQNPTPAKCYNLVVLGGGTAGLVSAIGAAGIGARVALVERHFLGGDCLNTGCVPSKALLHSARAAQEIRNATALGVSSGPVTVDFPAVMERVRRIRAEISPHDSAARCRDAGVDVFLGEARFTGRDTLTVGGATLRFSKAAICTGGRPRIPEIPGLSAENCLTSEIVFNLTELPRRLLVLGGGPIGCELAQAFQRLGAAVTLLQSGARLLPKDDAEAAAIVAGALEADGVEVLFNANLREARPDADGFACGIEHAGQTLTLSFDRILAAAGRQPNVHGLGLEDAGVAFDETRGITVDDHLRTSNPRIFAAGDCCMDWKFTHAADFAARIVIQNALFPFLPKRRLSKLTMAWCTYTDPELAHVGLTEEAARKGGIEIDTYAVAFEDVDRAITDSRTEGLLRIHCRKDSDKILGATLVSPHAGETITQLTLAITQGIGLSKLASVIHPYPTQADAIRKAADNHNRRFLRPPIKKILRALMSIQR